MANLNGGAVLIDPERQERLNRMIRARRDNARLFKLMPIDDLAEMTSELYLAAEQTKDALPMPLRLAMEITIRRVLHTCATAIPKEKVEAEFGKKEATEAVAK